MYVSKLIDSAERKVSFRKVGLRTHKWIKFITNCTTMEVNLADNVKPHGSSMLNAPISGSGVDVDMMMMGVVKEEVVKKEENKNCTITGAGISIADNDGSGLLLANFPKAEVKLKKLDEAKLLMDNNENSLSVDTLIEILSSTNETKLPIIDNVKSELINIDNDMNVPPTSVPSTLNSPSSSSSTSSLSKSGFNSPSATETSNNSSTHTTTSLPAPHKKFPSPHPSMNGGKPMLSDLNKKMKQIARRQPKPKAVYQSQISDNSVGIKLCIKKSINTFKAMPSPNSNNANNKSSRKRSRKSNKSSSSKGRASDSDDPYVKRRKKPSSNDSNNSSKAAFEEPIEQSVWGKAIPKEVLIEVN